MYKNTTGKQKNYRLQFFFYRILNKKKSHEKIFGYKKIYLIKIEKKK